MAADDHFHRARSDDTGSSGEPGKDEQEREGGLRGRGLGSGQLMRGRSRRIVWVVFAVLLLLWGWGLLSNRLDARTEIPYTAFRDQLQADNVVRVTVTGQQIDGELREPARIERPGGQTVSYEEFVTYMPSFGDEELMPLLEEKGVEVESIPESDFSWTSLLISLAPMLILVWLGLMFFRRMQAQGQNIFGMGQSRAKPYDKEQLDTTFEDVAGLEGAKQELREIVKYLKEPEHFERLGGEVPRGVLLKGPPGTGKTLMARAVAGEADVPFFMVTGSDFMEMLVGVGASRVRSMFEDAKEAAPAIIFIDELDSIGRRRGAGIGGGHDEREQTLNQLLSEMDGFDPHENVVVMAATNRPDILDPALLRPGRFDRQVTVDMPTRSARLQILRLHAKDKPLADDVDLEEVAAGTPGFSGADLENLLNEAALLAARREHEEIAAEDIDEARDKVLMGLEREGLELGEDVMRTLAYHESGHALLAAVLPHADPLHKVTIVPRGRAMGVTQQLPEEEQYIYQREYLLDRLTVMLGGRASEQLVLDTSTSGAADDLKQATRLARKMVLDWGMSERFGSMALGDDRENVFLGEELARRRDISDETAREVDEEVQSILDTCLERALDALEERRDGLDRLAEALMEEEEIVGDRVLELVGVSGDGTGDGDDENESGDDSSGDERRPDAGL